MQDKSYDAESLATLCRSTLSELLRRTNIPMPNFDISAYGNEVELLARREIQTWDIGNVAPSRIESGLVAGIDVARTAYKHTPLETQVHIALWTALCIYVDDFDIGIDAISEFPARFHGGRKQLHPLLDIMVDYLRRMPHFFHDYGAAAIVTSTIQFIACTLLDKQAEGVAVNRAAREYPMYKRARNSVGEAYAFCIWDKVNFPDVTTHVQATSEAIAYIILSNDLISFYKEGLEGEKHNFIHDRARVTGKDIETTLMDTLEDVVSAVDRGRQILEGEKERQVWESFVAEMLAFHFLSPRYKIEQLFSGSRD